MARDLKEKRLGRFQRLAGPRLPYAQIGFLNDVIDFVSGVRKRLAKIRFQRGVMHMHVIHEPAGCARPRRRRKFWRRCVHLKWGPTHPASNPLDCQPNLPAYRDLWPASRTDDNEKRKSPKVWTATTRPGWPLGCPVRWRSQAADAGIQQISSRILLAQGKAAEAAVTARTALAL